MDYCHCIADKLDISCGSAYFINHEGLGVTKYVEGGLQSSLQINTNGQSGNMHAVLSIYCEEGETFLRQIVTCEETRVNHYEPVSRHQT
jgi:hypothetical protein